MHDCCRCKSKQKKTIGKAEIEDIIAKIARIPPQTVNQDDRSKLQTIDRDLRNVVFGQDPAIEALASAIKLARAGLREGDVILSIANTEIGGVKDLEAALAKVDKNKPINVLYRRGEWAQYALIRPSK